jgi:hypothetical protein
MSLRRLRPPATSWDDPFVARALRRNLTAALVLFLLAALVRAARL